MFRKLTPIQTSETLRTNSVYSLISDLIKSKHAVLEAMSVVFASDVTTIMHDLFSFDYPVTIEPRYQHLKESERWHGIFMQYFVVHMPSGFDATIPVGFPLCKLERVRFFDRPSDHILEYNRVFYRNDFWYWSEAVEAFARQVWFVYLELESPENKNWNPKSP